MGVFKKIGNAVTKPIEKAGKSVDKHVIQPTIKPVKKPIKKAIAKGEKYGTTVRPSYGTNGFGPGVTVNYSK